MHFCSRHVTVIVAGNELNKSSSNPGKISIGKDVSVSLSAYAPGKA